MKWIFTKNVTSTEEIISVSKGNKIVADVLTRKGIIDENIAKGYLDPKYFQPSSPYELPGMDIAVQIVEKAIESQTTIGVWGDFDVDGQTSTTLLVSGLEQLGAKVIYHIPVRDTESHGVKIPFLKTFIEEGAELLLTCDTGITDNLAVDFAKEQGLQVIITDHHDLPPTLPNADVILNSKLLSEDHPSSSLPGVGVAYKLIEALFVRKERADQLVQFLDLVALGVVADVATLKGDARYLVQIGLRELRNTKRLGLKALYKEAKLEAEFLTEMDIGFGIAPRLNALGRLSNANKIVEFFTTEDNTRAEIIASQLEGLNERRKAYTKQIYAGAISQIEMNPDLLSHSALVLTNSTWPAGVIGIVASKLGEKYHKPVVLLSNPAGEVARGSARSVEGCDINKAITECKKLLEGFGGHPMAAGLAIKSENIDAFRKKLSKAVFDQIGGIPSEPELSIDTKVKLIDLNVPFINSLRPLAPFGAGNPALVFMVEGVKLIRDESLGRGGEHRKLLIEDHDGNQETVLWFNGESGVLPKENFNIAFGAANNFFKNELSLQLTYLDFEATEFSTFNQSFQALRLIDYRANNSPKFLLEELINELPNIEIWYEGNLQIQKSKKRWELLESKELAMVGFPPSNDVLRQILTRVNSETIYLLINAGEYQSGVSLLQKMLGMVKFALKNHEGIVEIEKISSALGTSREFVKLGIAWMQAKGFVSAGKETDGVIKISDINNPMDILGDASKIQEDIQWLQNEYRNYQLVMEKMDVENLKSIFSNILQGN